MTFLASLALLTLALPQGNNTAGAQDPTSAEKAPLLTAAEQSSLHDKLRKLLSAEMARAFADNAKERKKATSAKQEARDDFDDAWKKLEKKGNLVGSITDMKAVFENCFTVKRYPNSLAQLRATELKDEGVTYSIWVPKGYKETVPMRTVIMLPSATAATGGTWVKPASYFAEAWDKTAALGNNIFQVCHAPQDLEFDPVPDFSREGAETEDERRRSNVWIGLREVLEAVNVDRARIFLDGGRGSCAFAVRFATMFPDRFAGLVLRYPTPIDDIRLGSLLGLPILLLKNEDTAKDFDSVEKALKAASGNVTVIDATDAYPHIGSAQAIDDWMNKQRRNMTPSKIIIEPNHDRFHRSYWAAIDTADSLLTSAPDKKPRLEVEADRSANRIVVKAVGIERFRLYLNDNLVDLDKEFTVVVNDKAVSEKRQRSFSEMMKRVVGRNDWDCLFPVEYVSTVAK